MSRLTKNKGYRFFCLDARAHFTLFWKSEFILEGVQLLIPLFLTSLCGKKNILFILRAWHMYVVLFFRDMRN